MLNILTSTINNSMRMLLWLVYLAILTSNCQAEVKPLDKLPLTELERFSTVVEHIKNYYVNPIEDTVLYESAIRGLLAGLDPHSAYLNEEEYAELKVSTSGKFGGVGMEVTLEDGFIRVIAPIDDTPAQRAGVQAGDIVIRLDETPVKGLSLKDAVDMMRGKPGTEITLTVLRAKQAQPIKIKVIRDIINVQSVKSKVIEDHYAYFRISQFQSDTGADLIKEIKALKKTLGKKLYGVLIDLRNNPGGILEASVEVTDSFLDKEKLKHNGVIVYTKGRMGAQITEKAKSKDILENAPLVVLVNGGSASASEIVAGALQDHRRAIIVGTKTFGKGSVQTILPLKDQRGLKLTTALYYTPAGRSIQALGITPDITIEDVTLPKPEKDLLSELLLKEADLSGHLETNNNQQNQEAVKTKPNGEDTQLPLMYTDYQLYQALNILKGLHVSVASAA